MKLLAIDTAGDICSCALQSGDKVYSREEKAIGKHTLLLLPMIEDILTEAKLSLNQLNALSLIHGPGSFTGLRIAAGVVQGIGFGIDLPVICLSRMQASAQLAFSSGHHTGERVFVLYDARMGEVFFAEYILGDDGFVRLVGEEILTRPEEISLPSNDKFVAVGDGWLKYAHILPDNGVFYPECVPSAKNILPLAGKEYTLGNYSFADEIELNYIRKKVTG